MRKAILEKINGSKNKLSINLANMKIQDCEIAEIILSITANQPGISRLNLDNNQIGDAGAHTLKEALQECHQLSELSIQYNRVGRAGALALFSLKKELQHLDILFRGNQISDTGEMMEIETQAMQSAPNL
jgi:Leucine-rich repeat (LRR) protein